MKMLVAGQFLTAALLVVRAGPDVTECPACIAGAVLAAALGLSAVMTLRRSLRILPGPAANAELRTTGPYRWVRHPMYLALLIFCGMAAIADNSLFSWSVWGLLFTILLMKIRIEERLLRETFPNYDRYSLRVRCLIPFIF